MMDTALLVGLLVFGVEDLTATDCSLSEQIQLVLLRARYRSYTAKAWRDVIVHVVLLSSVCALSQSRCNFHF